MINPLIPLHQIGAFIKRKETVMLYQEALVVWGRRQLEQRVSPQRRFVEYVDIHVSLDLEQGICSQEDCHICYHDQEDQSHVQFLVTGRGIRASGSSESVHVVIPEYGFSLTDFIQELCEAGQGSVEL